MNNVEQAMVCLCLELARNHPGSAYRGALSSLRGATERDYRLEKFSGAFDAALEFLVDRGMANIHRYEGVEDYVSIKSPDGEFGALIALTTEEIFSFGPKKNQQFPVIATYLDVGQSWLHDYVMALSRKQPADLTEEMRVESSSWTGRFQVDEINQRKLSAIIVRMRTEIDGLALTNTEKANVLAALNAISELTKAPDPAWAVVIRILQSPVLANVTALAALAISIIKN